MWVITREAEEAAATVSALADRGVAAVALPCIRFEPRPWPDDLPEDALYVVTSPRVAALLDRPGRIAALDACARRLLRPADLVAAGGAEALARAIVEAGLPGPYLYPTSDRGLATDEQARAVAVLEKIGPVRRFPVVSTVPADASAAARFPPSAWAFLSPSAVDALFDQVSPEPASAVLCHGTSTSDAYLRRRPPSWPAPVVSHGDPVAAICRLEGR